METVTGSVGSAGRLEPKSPSEKGVVTLEPYIDITDDQQIRTIYGKVPPLSFQYWPESLSDTKDSAWEERRIPGLSHPLYHWAQGGPRTLSFTAVFVRDNDPLEIDEGSIDTLVGGGADKHLNYDIEAAIDWLHSFQLPSYTDDLEPLSPPKLLMVFQGMRLGLDGDVGVMCHLASMDITRQSWFPSGYQRYTEVALSFVEMIQKDLRIFTKSRAVLLQRTQFQKKLPSPQNTIVSFESITRESGGGTVTRGRRSS